nr:hypothetical protein [Tanacetum cinerariifolium]
FGDQFINDKPTEADNEKTTAETEKRKQDSPKTPPGSPPSPPPPPPPGASGASGSTGASDSAQDPPPLPPPSSSHQGYQSTSTAAPSSSKTAATTQFAAWTTTDVRSKPVVAIIPEDLHMDEDMTEDDQACSSSDEDIVVSYIHIEEEEKMEMKNEKNVDGHIQCVTTKFCIRLYAIDGHECELKMFLRPIQVKADTLKLIVQILKTPKLSSPFPDEHSSLTLEETSIEGKPIQMMWVPQEEVERDTQTSTQYNPAYFRSAGSDGVSEVQVVEPKWVNDAPHELIGIIHTSSDYMMMKALQADEATEKMI